LLGIGLLVLILSALISYVVSRSITHPVEAMTLAAEQIARGNLNQQIEVQTKDEVGRLAAAFNVMTREMARIQRTQQDFMINVSHDLQTPLTSIRGFAQAIVEGAVRDVAGITKAGRIIYEEANRMKRLVDALLNLVRLEAGQLELVQLPVNLVQLLRSCVQRFQGTADAAGIALRLDLPPGLPQVQGDSERLGQSFANLLDNALKFTPPDGRVVISGYVLGSQRLDTESHRLGKAGKRAIRQAPFLSNGRWVVITVADTGIGMTDEETTRVFERFYRADQSRAGREGIGLGLSIAQEIVEAHGGHITVSSRPGQGSQFHVALPIRARNDTEKTER
jgi:signal transduction histidine kinase